MIIVGIKHKLPQEQLTQLIVTSFCGVLDQVSAYQEHHQYTPQECFNIRMNILESIMSRTLVEFGYVPFADDCIRQRVLDSLIKIVRDIDNNSN